MQLNKQQSQVGAGGSLFGNSNNNSSSLFGNNNNNNANPQQQQPQSSVFGQQQQQAGGIFGNNTATNAQQQPQQNNQTTQGGGLFGQQQQSNNSGGIFGQQQQPQQQQQQQQNQQQQGSGILGQNNNNQQQQQSGQQNAGLFANTNSQKPAQTSTQPQSSNTGIFAAKPAATANTDSKQQQQSQMVANSQQQNTGLFGNNNKTATALGQPANGGIFNQQQKKEDDTQQKKPEQQQQQQKQQGGGGLFGNTSTSGQQQQKSSASASTSGGLFANNSAQDNNNKKQEENKPKQQQLQTGGSSLFGNNNKPQQQQQSKTDTSTAPASGGLFASNNNNNNNNNAKAEDKKPGLGAIGGLLSNVADKSKTQEAPSLGLGKPQQSQKVDVAPSSSSSSSQQGGLGGGLFAKKLTAGGEQVKSSDASKPEDKNKDKPTSTGTLFGATTTTAQQQGKSEDNNKTAVKPVSAAAQPQQATGNSNNAQQQPQQAQQQQQQLVKQDCERFSLEIARMIAKETQNLDLPIQVRYRSELFLQNLKLFSCQDVKKEQEKIDSIYIQDQTKEWISKSLDQQQKKHLKQGYDQLFQTLDQDIRMFKLPPTLLKYYIEQFLVSDPENKKEKQRQDDLVKSFANQAFIAQEEKNSFYKYLLQSVVYNYLEDRVTSLKPLLNIIENEWIRKNKVGVQQQSNSVEFQFLKENAASMQRNLIQVYRQIHDIKIQDTLPFDMQADIIFSLFKEQQMVIQSWIGIIQVLQPKKIKTDCILEQIELFRQEGFQGFYRQIPQSINLQKIKQKIQREKQLVETSILVLLLSLGNYQQKLGSQDQQQQLSSINPLLLLKSNGKSKKPVQEEIQEKIRKIDNQNQIDVEQVFNHMLYMKQINLSQQQQQKLLDDQQIQNNIEYILVNLSEQLEYIQQSVIGHGGQCIKQVAYIPEVFNKYLHDFVFSYYQYILQKKNNISNIQFKLMQNQLNLCEYILEKIYRKKTYLLVQELKENIDILDQFYNKDFQFKVLKFVFKILKHQTLKIKEWAMSQFERFLPDINNAFQTWIQSLVNEQDNPAFQLQQIQEKLKLVLQVIIYDPSYLQTVNHNLLGQQIILEQSHQLQLQQSSSEIQNNNKNNFQFLNYLFLTIAKILQLGPQVQFEEKSLVNFIKKIYQTLRALINSQYLREPVYELMNQYTTIFSFVGNQQQYLSTTYAWFQPILCCQDQEIKSIQNKKSAEKLVLQGLNLFKEYIRIFLTPNKQAKNDEIFRHFVYSILPYSMQYSQQILHESIVEKSSNVLKIHSVIMKIYTIIFAVHKDMTSSSILQNSEYVNLMVDQILFLFRVEGTQNLSLYQEQIRIKQRQQQQLQQQQKNSKDQLHVDTGLLFRNSWFQLIQENSHFLYHYFNKGVLNALRCLESILKVLQEVQYFGQILKDDQSSQFQQQQQFQQGNLNLLSGLFNLNYSEKGVLWVFSSIKGTNNNRQRKSNYLLGKEQFRVNFLNILKQFIDYKELYQVENSSQKYVSSSAFNELSIKNQRFINKIYEDTDFESLDNVFLQEYSQNKRFVGEIRTKALQLFGQVFIYNNSQFQQNSVELINQFSSIIFQQQQQITNDRFQEQFVNQVINILVDPFESQLNKIEASELVYVILKTQPQLAKQILTKNNIRKIYQAISMYFFKKEVKQSKQEDKQQSENVKQQIKNYKYDEELSSKFISILNHIYVNDRNLLNWDFVEGLIDFLVYYEQQNPHNYLSNIKQSNKAINSSLQKLQQQQNLLSIQANSLDILCDKKKKQSNIYSQQSLTILLNIQLSELAYKQNQSAYSVVKELIQVQKKFAYFVYMIDYEQEYGQKLIQDQLELVIQKVKEQYDIDLVQQQYSSQRSFQSQQKEKEFEQIKNMVLNLHDDFVKAQDYLEEKIQYNKKNNRLYFNNNSLGLFDTFNSNMLLKQGNFRNNYVLFYQHFRDIMVKLGMEDDLEEILQILIQDNYKRQFQHTSQQLMLQWSDLFNLCFSMGIKNQFYNTCFLKPQQIVEEERNEELFKTGGQHGFLELLRQNNEKNESYDTILLREILEFLVLGLQEDQAENNNNNYNKIKYCKLLNLHSTIKGIRYILNLDKREVDLIVEQNQNIDNQQQYLERQQQIKSQKISIDFSWVVSQEHQIQIAHVYNLLKQHIMKLESSGGNNQFKMVYLSLFSDFVHMVYDIQQELNVQYRDIFQVEELEQIIIKFLGILLQQNEQKYFIEFSQLLQVLNNLDGQFMNQLLLFQQDLTILEFILETLESNSTNLQIFVSYMQLIYSLSQGNQQICQVLLEEYNFVEKIVTAKGLVHIMNNQYDLYQNNNFDVQENSRAEVQSYDMRSISSIYFSWVLNVVLNICEFYPSFDFLKLYENRISQILANTQDISQPQLQDIENIGLMVLSLQKQLEVEKYDSQNLSQDHNNSSVEIENKNSALQQFMLQYIMSVQNMVENYPTTKFNMVSAQTFGSKNIKEKREECEVLFCEISLQNILSVVCIMIDSVFRQFLKGDGDQYLGQYVQSVYQGFYSIIQANIKRLQQLSILENLEKIFLYANKQLVSQEYQQKSGGLYFLTNDVTPEDFLIKLHLNCIMMIKIQNNIAHFQIESLDEYSSKAGKEIIDRYVEKTDEYLQDLKYLLTSINKMDLKHRDKILKTVKGSIGDLKSFLHNFSQYSQLNTDNTYEDIVLYIREYQRDKYQNFYI